MRTSFVLPLLFLSAAGHGTIALAQSPGTFSVTGSMTTPRLSHTATLLPSGKVLVAGGIRESLLAISIQYLPPPNSTILPLARSRADSERRAAGRVCAGGPAGGGSQQQPGGVDCGVGKLIGR